MVQTQNNRGEWVPAIPMPYILSFGRARCSGGLPGHIRCKAVFLTQRRYREHYALVHILGLD